MGGKWVPGQSGNPKGRSIGSGDVAKLRTSIMQRLPDVINAMVIAAKGGDTSAAKLLLERTCPVLKGVDLPILLENWQGTIEERSVGLLRAMEQGQLSPDTALTMLGALRQAVEITALQDIVERLEKLEQEHEQSGVHQE